MESWEDFPILLLVIAAVLLATLAIFDLAWVTLLLFAASLIGEFASLIPGVLGRLLAAVVTLASLYIAARMILCIASIVVAVLLFRFARRVESGEANGMEKALNVALLAAILVISIPTARWYHAAAAVLGLIGALMTRVD